MAFYKRTLVPLDGSQLSEAVLSKITKMAISLKAHITILKLAYSTRTHDVQDKVVKEAAKYVNTIIGQLKSNRSNIDGFVGYALDTAKRILDYAATYDIDLIMMSTRGYTGAKHRYLVALRKK